MSINSAFLKLTTDGTRTQFVVNTDEISSIESDNGRTVKIIMNNGQIYRVVVASFDEFISKIKQVTGKEVYHYIVVENNQVKDAGNDKSRDEVVE